MSQSSRFKRLAIIVAISLVAMANAHAHAPYHSHPAASEASAALSLLPVAVSVGTPALVISGGVALTVVAVEASATGTVLLLERASDGARSSVHLAGHVSAGIGTAIAVTAVSAGWVLSAAGEAIAFIPNELGAALLYNERISR